jgi:hypothetical protein
VTSQSYTVTNLNFGTTYLFVVEVRNSYGYSQLSNALQMLCAFKPDPPTLISTSNEADRVKVEWNEAIANGSPITEFRVYIQESD